MSSAAGATSPLTGRFFCCPRLAPSGRVCASRRWRGNRRPAQAGRRPRQSTPRCASSASGRGAHTAEGARAVCGAQRSGEASAMPAQSPETRRGRRRGVLAGKHRGSASSARLRRPIAARSTPARTAWRTRSVSASPRGSRRARARSRVIPRAWAIPAAVATTSTPATTTAAVPTRRHGRAGTGCVGARACGRQGLGAASASTLPTTTLTASTPITSR
jgi:hypothetical protein